jgi:CRP/FNR family transcriptional regulator
MAQSPVPHRRDVTRAGIVRMLRRGCWSSLRNETIESLIDNGRIVEFAGGQTMYAEADPVRLAVVIEGLLRAYMHAGDGRQVTVRYARAGDLLGVPALVGGAAPVFVQAVTSGAAFLFDVAVVERIARHDATVAWAFAQESVRRLYDVLEELAGNAFASVRQRVARHLLDLAMSQGDMAEPLTAFVSQQDLANSVGSVREVVARILGELRAEHLIHTSPGRVEILDPVGMSRELWDRSRDESHSG